MATGVQGSAASPSSNGGSSVRQRALAAAAAAGAAPPQPLRQPAHPPAARPARRRGATFGCLHGPCTAVYHFPCARVLAYKAQLVFSLQSRDMACPKHVKLWVPAGAAGRGAGAGREAEPAAKSRLHTCRLTLDFLPAPPPDPTPGWSRPTR
jgi:hypothetical protein